MNASDFLSSLNRISCRTVFKINIIHQIFGHKYICRKKKRRIYGKHIIMLPAATYLYTYIRKRNQKHKHYDFEYLRKRDGRSQNILMYEKCCMHMHISTSIERCVHVFLLGFFLSQTDTHTHLQIMKKKTLLAQVDVTF